MWIKKLRKRKLQSVLITLIVMVCAMLMTSSIVIMTSWKEPYNELSKQCNSPTLKLYLFQPTKENAIEVQNKFEELKEVEIAEVIDYSYLTQKVSVSNNKNGHKEKASQNNDLEKDTSEDNVLEGFYDLVTYNKKLHDHIRVIDGDRNNLEDKECLLPAVVANKYNIQIGDVIKIGSEHSYTVKGIYTDPYNTNIAFDVEIIVNQIPKELESKYYVAVFPSSTITGIDLIDKYRENNDTILEGRGNTIESRISNSQMTEQIFGGILLGMSVIILLVSGIMIKYMIKSALISDKRTVAIYKTMGYKNKHIIGIYLKLYLFLVLAGSIIGAFLSKLVSDSFTKTTFKKLGVTSSNGVFIAGVLCVSIIALYVILQVYFVLNKTKKIRPMEVFQGENTISVNGRKANSRYTNFSPFGMAIRMIGRGKKSIIIIVITCIMSTYCVNFAVTALNLMKGMSDMNYYWIGFDKHDISMEVINSAQYDNTISKLRSMNEIKRVIPTTTNVAVSIPWKKGIGDTILSSMIFETFEDIEMPVIEGRNPRYSDEIAIGNSVAVRLNKHVGDYIDIYFNGNQKVTLLICGTFQSFYDMGKSCRLLGDTLTENHIDFKYSESSIYIKDSSNINNVIEKLNAEFKDDAKFINRINKYESIMNMINGPQMMAMKPFVALALLLGGLNIIAIVYLKNKDNSKTNSIYKAIGYSANHLLLTNMFYILIIASISVIITVPTFMLVFPKTMVLSMSMFGFKEYPVTYDAMALIISNVGTIIVFVISGLLSSKSLYVNPIDDLTCE